MKFAGLLTQENWDILKSYHRISDILPYIVEPQDAMSRSSISPTPLISTALTVCKCLGDFQFDELVIIICDKCFCFIVPALGSIVNISPKSRKRHRWKVIFEGATSDAVAGKVTALPPPLRASEDTTAADLGDKNGSLLLVWPARSKVSLLLLLPLLLRSWI